MKVVWASSSGQAQDGCETCVFFFLFAFSLSIVLSERAKVNEAQEHKNDADRSRRHSAQNVRTASEKSTKNRSKIVENPCQIHQKSTKNRSWAVLGAQGRFGDASGRARDGFWTPKCRPKTYLGASRAAQERPVAPQDASRRPRSAPDASPERPGSLTKPDCGTERSSRPVSTNF